MANARFQALTVTSGPVAFVPLFYTHPCSAQLGSQSLSLIPLGFPTRNIKIYYQILNREH